MKKTILTLLLCLVLGIFGMGKIQVFAEGAVLELSPVNQRINLDAGKNTEGTFTVKNLTVQPITISVFATPFSDGVNKARDFETETYYTQISNWISIRDASGDYKEKVGYTLGANEEKELSYKITVPEIARGGGQYASIIVELNPDEGAIRTVSRAGMVIYATISGEIKREAEILDINASGFMLNKNLGVEFTVKNAGNIDFQASGELAVSSIFSKELYRDSFVFSVFPEDSKVSTLEWSETPMFGIYRLEYKISALDKTETGSKVVLALTTFTLVIAVVLFLLTIVSLFFLVKRHVKSKRRLV